jgi:phage/plasmid-associated DNA primase
MNNIHEAIKFFKFLNKSEKAVFTCAWFDANGAILPGFSCCFYNANDINELKYIYNKVPQINSRTGSTGNESTLHTTLLETNGLGRRTENMKGVRVLCVDLDRVLSADELAGIKKMAPGLIVESSPGKYHVYWKVSFLIPVERWSMYQIGLAWRLGGDLNLGQPTHMMRVPGFERVCKDGTLFESRIVFETELVAELTEKGVLAAWPEIGVWAEKGREKLAAERKAIGELARKAWKGGLVGKEGTLKTVIEAGRNSVMYFTVKDACYKEGLGLEDAVEYGLGLNKCFAEGLGVSEVRETCRKAWNKAQQALERKAERDKEAVAVLSEVVEVLETRPWDIKGPEVEPLVAVDVDVDREQWNKRLELTKKQVEKDFGPFDGVEPPIEPPIRTGYHEPNKENTCRVGQELKPEHLFQEVIMGEHTVDWWSKNGGNGHSNETVVSLVESETNFSDRGIDPVIRLNDESFLENDKSDFHSCTSENENGSLIPGKNENEKPDKTADKKASKIQEIPESLIEVADRFGDILWGNGSEEGRHALAKLSAAVRMKQAHGFAKYVCSRWHLVGVFRKDGIYAHVKHLSKYGESICYPVKLPEEGFKSVIEHALKVLDSKTIREDGESKPITNTQLMVLSKVALASAELWAVEPRQKPDIIVFQNGVFDLGSGLFTEDLMAPIKYSHPIWCRFDRDIEARLGQGEEVKGLLPVFSKYMTDWFPADTGIVRLLLRFMGYSMTTDFSKQKFCFFYGPTRAGKGSIARLLCGLLGSSNYCSGDYTMLDNTFKTIGIHNKLVVCFEEVEGSAGEHEKRMGYLKKLLGGERIMFEAKYGQPFEDDVTAKFILQSNEPPNYQDKGHAVRSRMIVVGFEKSFEAENEVDPAAQILQVEAGAIATLSAIAWSKARKEKQPLQVDDSRALDTGLREVTDNLDLVDTFVRKYLVRNTEGRIKSSVITDLITSIAEMKNIKLSGRIELKIKSVIEQMFPMSRYGNKFMFDSQPGRGYIGIELNSVLLYENYPELQNDVCEGKMLVP